MSLKTPTFWSFSAKFGAFLLLGGKLSVSASHRFFASENFSISARTAVRTTFFPKTEIFFKVLKYLSEQRYPLTSPNTMTKRTTYYSNTTGGQTTLTAGDDHRGDLPKNQRLPKPRFCPNKCPDEKKGQKTKDRMSMLRPLFLSE